MSELNNLKIGTLNLCLVLKNKKDLVRAILIENNIDILCKQETEVEHDFDCNLLSILGFVLEMENNGVILTCIYTTVLSLIQIITHQLSKAYSLGNLA